MQGLAFEGGRFSILNIEADVLALRRFNAAGTKLFLSFDSATLRACLSFGLHVRLMLSLRNPRGRRGCDPNRHEWG